MSEGLEYRLADPKNVRGNLIEIVAPKQLMDSATSAYGPLLDDLRAANTKRVSSRIYDGDGRVVLSFDLNRVEDGYFAVPVLERSGKSLAIITQLDAAAQRHGLADPRITIQHSDGVNALDDFRVSFQKPGDDSDVVARHIREGMVQAATLLRVNRSSLKTPEGIAVFHTEERGFIIRNQGIDRFPVLAQDIAASTPDRIIVAGQATRLGSDDAAHARLIALSGIVSALDPLPHQ